ncbi:alpha/beta fold hydrolase [Nonomuraea sp. NPDC050328]|uniref:alpha/beta fold hydrolase n=1 Tax=Nonomuraea sp. NPDC050328 TaxID=3364361 RepID=UPI0037A8154A
MPSPFRTRAGAALSALLGPVPLSRSQALGASERLSAVTSLLSSLEHLTHRRHRRPGGLNDWSISRESYAGQSRPVRRLLDLVAAERVNTALHAGRVAASAALLLPGHGRWRGAANLFLGVSGALLYPVHRYGTDGSDQAAGLVQTATGLARLSTTPQVQDALLWYVAIQSNLSYLVSGWVKLLGPDWRSGSALSGVMRTRTYGNRHVWLLTRRFPRSARLVAHGVLALECLFPVLYLKGGRLTRPVLGSALAFHVVNGFVMGLGRFIPSFAAMHPVVAYTSTPRSHPAVAGRDDRLLGSLALLAGAAAVGAASVAVSRRLRVTDSAQGGWTVPTRHGNELSPMSTVSAGGAGPVVVFEHGLGAFPAHFGWYTRALNAAGVEWLACARAGYGPSRRLAAEPYTLEESVGDLADLVAAAVPEGRQVVLAGHSLGGEIARRAAVRLGERVHAVVYLDSSHPGQLNRSGQQDKNSGMIDETVGALMVSLRLGLGVLMQTPEWIKNLPAPLRGRAMAEYADPRLWTAARREWRAAERDFRAFDGALDPLDTHALVLSAQHTVDRDPEHLLMHQDLAAAHAPERVVRTVVVEGADHDGILTSPEHAAPAIRHLLDFLAEIGSPATVEAR